MPTDTPRQADPLDSPDPQPTGHPDVESDAATGDEPTDAERDTLIAAFELTDVASHLLRRAHFRAEAMFMEHFQDEDITPRQKALLITVCKHPGATQNQLGDYIALDRNSLADMVNRMVRKGYLKRMRAAGDGRAYAVHITDSGFALLQRVLPRDKQVEDAIIGVLPAEYRALFMKCLKIVAGVQV
ncbi:hypothetical protein GCM10007242_17520 [Pigmentiphaga litoralis]|uniref:MarR family winged helix-turn-helix transcriptional regulator n=1 Tax=Pigmentiphaga litoralis TaxID=516702 RepID=UPI00167A636C|nr:MarR family transcriptional regulator [Pigmentiphaga litoralis]GGX11837.1 hypothetical protein GCM10007242_17520 [Pigmentiphaga litoralis]